MNAFRSQLIAGLAAMALPPAIVGGLYLYGSSTGCSGGDCTGPMMAIGILGLVAIPISITGAVWTLIVLVGELFRRVRMRRRDA